MAAASSGRRQVVRQKSAARFAPGAGLEQEPGASPRVVDPVLEQARARHVAMLVAQLVRSRMLAVSWMLSLRSSASMSEGVT
jgi:hypothetical protein